MDDRLFEITVKNYDYPFTIELLIGEYISVYNNTASVIDNAGHVRFFADNVMLIKEVTDTTPQRDNYVEVDQRLLDAADNKLRSKGLSIPNDKNLKAVFLHYIRNATYNPMGRDPIRDSIFIVWRDRDKYLGKD